MCGFCNVWVGVCMCGFCNVWVFGNMCTCIYCVLYCLYCVFRLFRLCIFILIYFVCTSVRTLLPSDNSIAANNDNNNNNNNNKEYRQSHRRARSLFPMSSELLTHTEGSGCHFSKEKTRRKYETSANVKSKPSYCSLHAM